MLTLRVSILAAVLLSMASAASAQDDGTKAEAEQAVQTYLAIWSNNKAVTAQAVTRFYAPDVVYYGKTFTRAQVLADKRSYIRAWPVRLYHEVPGTFDARCNVDRSLCKVGVDMTWRRLNARHAVSTGRARLTFDFITVDGGRKIARESARIL